MASHKHSRHGQRQKAHHMLKRAGYAKGGAMSGEGRLNKAEDAKEDRMIAAKAVHAHERHDHPGKPLTKLASGGAVSGNAAPQRLDKRARGGHISHGKKKPMVTVNVISPSNPGPNTVLPAPQPMPPAPGGGPISSGPVGLTPPPPAPPMGGMATGGKVTTSMRDGSKGPLSDIDRPTRKDVTERFYRGGELKMGPKMTGGAASGIGREEKAELEKRSKKS